MVENTDALSVPVRKAIFGLFGWLFTAAAVLRVIYGDVLFPLFLAVFAAMAFALRWMTGKWWAEL